MIRSSIDIGTNSVRLLVADLQAVPPLALVSDIRITRLGAGLDRSGVLSPEAVERTAAAVKMFVERAREAGSERVIVFGTAALREARNGPEAASAIEAAAGLGAAVRILTGQEESLVTYRGVLMGLVGGEISGNAMVLDIGGGSTEFIMGLKGSGSLDAPDAAPSIGARSLPLGSVRQTERHLHSDPPTIKEVQSLVTDVRNLVREGVAGRKPDRLYGVAGSVTQLVALETKMTKYDPSVTNGYCLSLEAVRRWRNLLASSRIEEKRTLPGMVPERAETVLAGAVILFETMRAIRVDSVHVSEYDSLWGALRAFGDIEPK